MMTKKEVKRINKKEFIKANWDWCRSYNDYLKRAKQLLKEGFPIEWVKEALDNNIAKGYPEKIIEELNK